MCARPHIDLHGLPSLSRLLASARGLRNAPARSVRRLALRGSHLGLLTREVDKASAERFCRAAEALGAHVSQVTPALTDSSLPADIDRLAGVLARLYSGIECQGIAPSLVGRIAAKSGVPVFAGLATPAHPLAEAVTAMGGEGSDEEKWIWLIQAVLLERIG
ncbi:hypothetical protein [Rhodoferax koreensis]|nr:hypothetical protein [Rhodoferax koreense]